MPVSAQVGHLTKPSVTGPQSTSTTFQAKAAIQFLTKLTAFGTTQADTGFGMGFATSTTSRGAHGYSMPQGDTPPTPRRGLQTTRLAAVPRRNTNTADAEADLDSFTATNYTINWTTLVSTAAWLCPYALLGGTDITGAEVVSWTIDGSGAGQNQTVTGFSAEPRIIINAYNGRTSAGYGTTGAWMLGVANTSSQWGMMTLASTGNPTNSGRIFRSDCCLVADSLAGETNRASLTGMVSNGFTIHWDDTPSPSDGQIIHTLALYGTFANLIEVFNKPTGTPTATASRELGFAGAFTLLASAQKTTGTATADHNRFGIGLFDGTNQRSFAGADEDNVAASNVDSYISQTRGFQVCDNATATLDAEATLAYTGTALDFNWTTNHATATELGQLTIGSASGGPTTRGLYRRAASL